MLPERTQFEQDLRALLQETSLFRPLDSLDTILVLSYLAARNIDVPDDSRPTTNTIGGWLVWGDQFSHDG